MNVEVFNSGGSVALLNEAGTEHHTAERGLSTVPAECLVTKHAEALIASGRLAVVEGEKPKTEAQIKTEADALKAKTKADAKTKARLKAEAKADSKAAAKAEAEAKVRAEAEAKATEEAEAAAKEEAEFQAELEAEEKAKVEAEAGNEGGIGSKVAGFFGMGGSDDSADAGETTDDGEPATSE